MVNRRFFQNHMIPAACVILLLASTALASTAGATEIYRWVDAEGNVNFGDRPPADHPVQQIQVLPPTGAGPLAQGGDAEEAEQAQERPARPQAVIVPGRLPAAD